MRIHDRHAPRYYPLLDTEDDGSEKTPLFPINDERICSSHCRPYLSEIIPHIFRIHGATKNFTIRCPYCGSHMKRITKQTDGAIYECPSCK